MIKKGSSYLSNPDITPQEKRIRHLRIIISDFDEADRALVVPITTWHEGNSRQDNSCILEQGEHSFITHKSWADYSRAESMTYDTVSRGIESGYFIPKEDISPELLERLQQGALTSEFLQQAFEHFFQDF